MRLSIGKWFTKNIDYPGHTCKKPVNAVRDVCWYEGNVPHNVGYLNIWYPLGMLFGKPRCCGLVGRGMSLSELQCLISHSLSLLLMVWGVVYQLPKPAASSPHHEL